MTPLQHLNALADAQYAAAHPDIPMAWLPPQRYKQNNANAVTQAIIAWVRLNGYQAERISVTGRMVDQRKTYKDVLGYTRQIGSVKWLKSSMQRGSADISCTIRGRSVKVEVKFGRDRQRPEQVEYQQQVEQAGGVYIIVGSFDEFYEWWHTTTL